MLSGVDRRRLLPTDRHFICRPEGAVREVCNNSIAGDVQMGVRGGGREVGYIFVSASWVIGYAPPSLHESHVTT